VRSRWWVCITSSWRSGTWCAASSLGRGEKDVRRFVLRHPTEIYLRKVDQLWFLDLITNGLVPSEIAHPTEVSIKTLLEPKEGNCRNRLSIRARPGSKLSGEQRPIIGCGSSYFFVKEKQNGNSSSS
jgi:hypothetical protein